MKIRSRKEAADIAREIVVLREALRTTKSRETKLSNALKAWMGFNNVDALDQEGEKTAVVSDSVNGYDWDLVHMPDEDVATLRRYGLLTVRKGEYDEVVKTHGPLGLLQRWATPSYSRVLRFEEPLPKQPRQVMEDEDDD